MQPSLADCLPLQPRADVETVSQTVRAPASGQPWMPILCNRADLRNRRLDPLRRPAAELLVGATVPFCETMAIAIGVERDARLHLLTAQTLHAAQGFDAALTAALARLAQTPPTPFRRMPGGFFLSHGGDGLDASRLLLPSPLEALPFFGKPVALVLGPDRVVVAAAADLSALEAMADFAKHFVQDREAPLSLAPIVLTSGGWQSYSGTVAALDALRIRQTLRDTAEQTFLLHLQTAEASESAYAAPLHATRSEDRTYTWTIWTPDAPTLLPAADAIVLNPADGAAPIIRAWHDVVAVCGAPRTEGDLWPLRWRFPRFPEDAAWRALVRRRAPGWIAEGA